MRHEQGARHKAACPRSMLVAPFRILAINMLNFHLCHSLCHFFSAGSRRRRRRRLVGVPCGSQKCGECSALVAARCVSLVCQKQQQQPQQQQEESCPASCSTHLSLSIPASSVQCPVSSSWPAIDDPVLFCVLDRFVVPLARILLSATAAQIVVHFRSQLIMRRGALKMKVRCSSNRKISKKKCQQTCLPHAAADKCQVLGPMRVVHHTFLHQQPHPQHDSHH